jgi:hypothetical protein
MADPMLSLKIFYEDQGNDQNMTVFWPYTFFPGPLEPSGLLNP